MANRAAVDTQLSTDLLTLEQSVSTEINEINAGMSYSPKMLGRVTSKTSVTNTEVGSAGDFYLLHINSNKYVVFLHENLNGSTSEEWYTPDGTSIGDL